MGGARGPMWPLPPAGRCDSRACIYGTACGIATASEAAEVLQNTCDVGAVPHRVDMRPHMRVPVNARVPCARSVAPVYCGKVWREAATATSALVWRQKAHCTA